MKLILETPRLLLREVDERDAQDFFDMDSNPLVVRYVGMPPVENLEKSLEIIHFIQKQYADYGIGRWAVVERDSGAFLGWCGLKRITNMETHGYRDFVDIGYRFQQKHWGKGYATEAAAATLRYGFDMLGFAEIFAHAALENLASHHVLTKIGMQRGDDFIWEGETLAWFWAKRPGGL